MHDGKINVALIGMGFGQYFVPIYLNHPMVRNVGICDNNREKVTQVAKDNNLTWVHTDLNEVINDARYDAVHILTPATTHGPISIQALKSGKHCASAVPMGLSIDEIAEIIQTVDETGLNYMMMETKVFDKEYFYAQELYQRGVLGDIQFMRGCHYQDLEEFNPIWRGLPPMWYMTHAISPLLDILDTTATEVHCYGSGKMREEFTAYYHNPYPVETAIFALDGTPAKAEITRSLFETAVEGSETFDIYGNKASFLCMRQEPRLVTIAPLTQTGERRGIQGRDCTSDILFRPDKLPKELASYALGGHGGSHPHLVHEFVSSIVEGRKPYIHERRAGNWTAPGICAHISAMKNGEGVRIPNF